MQSAWWRKVKHSSRIPEYCPVHHPDSFPRNLTQHWDQTCITNLRNTDQYPGGYRKTKSKLCTRLTTGKWVPRDVLSTVPDLHNLQVSWLIGHHNTTKSECLSQRHQSSPAPSKQEIQLFLRPGSTDPWGWLWILIPVFLQSNSSSSPPFSYQLLSCYIVI